MPLSTTLKTRSSSLGRSGDPQESGALGGGAEQMAGCQVLSQPWVTRFLHKLRAGPITHPSFPSVSVVDSGDFRKELMGHATSRFIPRRFSAFSRQNFKSCIHISKNPGICSPGSACYTRSSGQTMTNVLPGGAASGETKKASKLLRLVVPRCEMHRHVTLLSPHT